MVLSYGLIGSKGLKQKPCFAYFSPLATALSVHNRKLFSPKFVERLLVEFEHRLSLGNILHLI